MAAQVRVIAQVIPDVKGKTGAQEKATALAVKQPTK